MTLASHRKTRIIVWLYLDSLIKLWFFLEWKVTLANCEMELDPFLTKVSKEDE